MLRYLRATQMMKKIIEENNLTVMATIARYAAAYEAIAKLDWWNKAKRCAHSPTASPTREHSCGGTLQRGPNHRAGDALLRSLAVLWRRGRHFDRRRALARLGRGARPALEAPDRRVAHSAREPHSPRDVCNLVGHFSTLVL